MSRQFAGLFWNRGQSTLLSPNGRPRGGVLRSLDRPAVRLQERPLGVVRLVPRPHHLAGEPEEQVQPPRRPSDRLQLRWPGVEHPAGGADRLPVRAEQLRAGDVQLAVHEPAAPRSRRRRVHLAVEQLPDDRCRSRTRSASSTRGSARPTAPRRRSARTRTTRTGRPSGRPSPT